MQSQRYFLPLERVSPNSAAVVAVAWPEGNERSLSVDAPTKYHHWRYKSELSYGRTLAIKGFSVTLVMIAPQATAKTTQMPAFLVFGKRARIRPNSIIPRPLSPVNEMISISGVSMALPETARECQNSRIAWSKFAKNVSNQTAN